VLAATRESVGLDEANSYLPFNGLLELREAVAGRLATQTGVAYDPEQDVVITCGGTEGLFDALLATVQEGDEVIVTDPTYVGMVSRVRLAGATPVFVPFRRRDDAWCLDLDALHDAVSNRTRALFVMNPSMPSGAVLDATEWAAIAAVCRDHGCWLIYNAAMERIVFDDRPVIHPAALDGLAEHVITVGSVSKEWRMIGWRVGWVAGPRAVMADITRAHLFNVVTPVSLTQRGAIEALRTPDGDVAAAVAEWQRRRDVVVSELAAYDVVPAAGASAAASRPRPWTAGARSTARSTSASCSPTSRPTGWRSWASGSPQRSASDANARRRATRAGARRGRGRQVAPSRSRRRGAPARPRRAPRPCRGTRCRWRPRSRRPCPCSR
jgi:N-succinyldiaminopimelate aminotransferase